jgi:hypothetical protein
MEGQRFIKAGPVIVKSSENNCSRCSPSASSQGTYLALWEYDLSGRKQSAFIRRIQNKDYSRTLSLAVAPSPSQNEPCQRHPSIHPSPDVKASEREVQCRIFTSSSQKQSLTHSVAI